MTQPPPDVLELLLPGAPELQRRAQRVTTFLRLLLHATRGERADAIREDLPDARDELERVVYDRLAIALASLLDAHLRARLDRDAFVVWDPPALGHEEAWAIVEEHRAEVADLPAVPGPGEPPLEVARRVLVSLERLGAGRHAGPIAAVHAGRFARAAGGPRAGEAHWRALLKDVAPSFELERIAVAEVASCLLDRGQVQAARTWLEERMHLVACDAGLARLYSWSALGAGDVDAARETVRGLPTWEGVLPARLVELRERRPEWLALLPGREPDTASGRESVEPGDRPSDRGDFGASVLGVFALGPARSAEPLMLDVAPGLKRRVGAWLREGDGACTLTRTFEHEVVATARPVVTHRRDATPLRGALDREARALALAPILFERGEEEGEVAGWLRIECAHHLLPSTERLVQLAATWREEVLAAAHGVRPEADVRPARFGHGEEEAAVADRNDPRVRALTALAGELGIKTAQRRWWAFEVEPDGPRLLAEGGGALTDWRDRPGKARAVQRAIATRSALFFDEPDERLSVHRGAASGLALPLVRGRVEAVLAIESARRRDFRAADVERHAERVRAFAPRWHVACFRAWHVEHFVQDVHIDPGTPGDGEGGYPLRPADVAAACRGTAPVAIVGEPGTSKEIVARWIHFESQRTAPLRTIPGAAGSGGVALLNEAPGGTVILDEVERASGELQEALVLSLRSRGGGDRPDPSGRRLRLVATLSMPPGEAVREGRLRADLGRALERLVLTTPPLRERRQQIPALVDLFTRRFADEEGLAEPALDDGALALLWRQPWTGNVRTLENLIYRLVLLHGGQEVGPDDVKAVARRQGLELRKRIPSRHPDRRDLIAALKTTRRGSGALNKTRAALYLGWDPDTLVARMRDAKLADWELREPE